MTTLKAPWYMFSTLFAQQNPQLQGDVAELYAMVVRAEVVH